MARLNILSACVVALFVVWPSFVGAADDATRSNRVIFLHMGSQRIWPTVIVGERDRLLNRNRGDERLQECIATAMSTIDQSIVIEHPHFIRDLFFPLFEPDRAPKDWETLQSLLQRPEVQARVASRGLRYLLVVEGVESVVTASGPGVICEANAMGAGCLGFKSAEQQANLQARLWDFGTNRQTQNKTAQGTGTAVVAAFIIPVLFSGNQLRDACNAVARDIAPALQRAHEVTTKGEP